MIGKKMCSFHQGLLVLMILAISSSCVFASDFSLFASYSFGYTHYKAEDLNWVMQALAEQSAEQGGLNSYEVDQFDGHPRQALSFGFTWKHWKLALEGELWVETFGQRDVPFYINRDLDPNFKDLSSVNCEQFRVSGFQPIEGGVAGCIDAQEIFTIIPLTLQLSYEWYFFRDRLKLGAGYGIGVLAGDAQIIVETEFIGDNVRPNDSLDLTLYPGLNSVHKFFGDAEWKPFSWVGLGLRGGFRISGMDYIEIQEKKGSSFLFGLILGEDSSLDEGDRAYLIQTPSSGENVLVLRGEPTQEEERQARLAGSKYHMVQGDFSGWFVELKLNAYFGL